MTSCSMKAIWLLILLFVVCILSLIEVIVRPRRVYPVADVIAAHNVLVQVQNSSVVPMFAPFSFNQTGSTDYELSPNLTSDPTQCDVSSRRHLVVLSWNLRKWIRLTGLVSVSDEYSPIVGCFGTSSRNNTCSFVEDTAYYDRADAIIFLGEFTSQRALPARLVKRQKRIFFSLESPAGLLSSGGRYARLIRQVTLYNVTSTYSLKSDIPSPYSAETCSIPEAEDTPTETELNELRSIVANKTRPAAWFVSHCRTSSRREDYVRQLNRYIPVDIFGRCGIPRCPLDVHAARPYADCDDRILQTTYKFYLSFENSLCDDYVTEKFFRIRHLDVVSVVLGAADYTQWMPPGTFVDVRNFRSPRHLADFLRRLDENDEAYLEMLHRKRRMVCRPFEGLNNDYKERLCSYLHKTYDTDQQADLRKIIDPRIACVRPQDFYRNISDLVF